MTDINFYHLVKLNLRQALPKLLDKILLGDKKVLLVAKEKGQLDEINDYLWSSTRAFIPHGTASDPYPEMQPVFITDANNSNINPNNADLLVLTGTEIEPSILNKFEKCMLLFDGNDVEQTNQARIFWKTCLAAGHKLIYWKQDSDGKWQKST